MSSHFSDSNVRPEPDAELVAIADYVLNTPIASDEAYDTARYCLMDSLGCAMLVPLQYPACVRHLGPIVEGAYGAERRARAGNETSSSINRAAFDIGCASVGDYNDTCPPRNGGHPSGQPRRDFVARRLPGPLESPVSLTVPTYSPP